MIPTEEQKERYLDLVAEGMLRHLAAQQVGLTNRAVRKLARDDPEFGGKLASTLENRIHPAELARAPYWQPTPEEEEEYLSYIREGDLRFEAAKKVGTIGSWVAYGKRNEEFAARYDQALFEGEAAFVERLRHEFRQRALVGGSDQLLSQLGKAMLPELRVLLSQRVELANPEGEALRILAGQASSLTDEELHALIERMEKLEVGTLRALPSAEEAA